jgi:hypothetical protein
MASQQKDDPHGYDRKSTTDNQHNACIVACDALPRLCHRLDCRTLFRHANLSLGVPGVPTSTPRCRRGSPRKGRDEFPSRSVLLLRSKKISLIPDLFFQVARYRYSANQLRWEVIMSLILIILIIILLLGGVGTYPSWGYSSGWGYGPSGIFGLLLVILIVLALLGRAPF